MQRYLLPYIHLLIDIVIALLTRIMTPNGQNMFLTLSSTRLRADEFVRPVT